MTLRRLGDGLVGDLLELLAPHVQFAAIPRAFARQAPGVIIPGAQAAAVHLAEAPAVFSFNRPSLPMDSMVPTWRSATSRPLRWRSELNAVAPGKRAQLFAVHGYALLPARIVCSLGSVLQFDCQPIGCGIDGLDLWNLPQPYQRSWSRDSLSLRMWRPGQSVSRV